MSTTTVAGCLECGAPADHPCLDTCIADHDRELDDEQDPPCCANAQVAARRLCACWGAPGQWIGSAT